MNTASGERARREGEPRKRFGRLAPPLALVLALFVATGAVAQLRGAGGPYHIYELCDRSEVVAKGRVRSVSSFAAGRFLVFDVIVEKPLKGAQDKPALGLVQDRGPKLGKEPLLREGQRVLVFATRLPDYSLYRKHLPRAEYWQWTEPYPTAKRLEALSAKEAVGLVEAYLALPKDDPKLRVAFVAERLASPLDWIRRDSIERLGQEADLKVLLAAEAVSAVTRYLSDERFPAEERGRLVSIVEEKKLEQLAPALGQLLEAGSGASGDALEALGALGHAPAVSRLLDYSRKRDPKVRAGAAHALGRAGSKRALERVGEMALRDPDRDVRKAAAAALGYSEAAVGILDRVLSEGEKEVKIEAARSLARIGTDEAVKVLSRRLYGEDNDAAAASVFALAQLRSQAAVAALNRALRTTENEHVRDLIMTLVPGGRE